jgi:hypothetical protein
MKGKTIVGLLIAGFLLATLADQVEEAARMPEEILDSDDENGGSSLEESNPREEPLINFEDPVSQKIVEGLENEAAEDQNNSPPPLGEQLKK